MARKRLFLSCLVLMALTGAGTALWGQAAGFAYVANCAGDCFGGVGPGNVSAYTFDGTTGALTPVAGSPFPAGVGPRSVTVHPTGRFVYVANLSSNNVSAYSVNGTTGALTPVAGSPFPAGVEPISVAVDPTGQFAYVANLNPGVPGRNISAYTIDAITGALTPVAGSPFPAGRNPSSVTVDPTGQFAYVVNSGANNDVSAYTINGATGALTPVAGSPFPAGTQPVSVTVDPTGRFAYVANRGSSNVSAYTINATTGALTPLVGSPFPAGSFPNSVTVDATGAFAYTANQSSNDVSAYTINGTTGALTPVAGSPFPAGMGPRSVTVDPTGQFAYVANGFSNNVSAYAIDVFTGALAPIAGSPFPAGSVPFSVSVSVKALERYQITVTLAPVTGETNSVVSGQSAQVQVQAIDNFGSVFSAYRGTVHFSSGNTTATLPADYAFTAADGGSHTFNITLRNVAGTSATRDLTVQDTLLGVLSIQNIFVWFQVTMDVELWKNCNFVSCPNLGSYFCQTAYNPNGWPQPTAFAALTQSSANLANATVTVRNGASRQTTFVGDAGPVLNNPYWNTGAVPVFDGTQASKGGCLTDVLMTNLGISNGCTPGGVAFGRALVFWRFGN